MIASTGEGSVTPSRVSGQTNPLVMSKLAASRMINMGCMALPVKYYTFPHLMMEARSPIANYPVVITQAGTVTLF